MKSKSKLKEFFFGKKITRAVKISMIVGTLVFVLSMVVLAICVGGD